MDETQKWFAKAQTAASSGVASAVFLNDVVMGKEYYVQNIGQHAQAGPDSFLDGVLVFKFKTYHATTERTYLRVAAWTRFNPDLQYEGTWWLDTSKTVVYEL